MKGVKLKPATKKYNDKNNQLYLEGGGVGEGVCESLEREGES